MNNEIKNEKEREVHIEQSAKKEDVLSEQERDRKLAETLAGKKPPAESDSDQGEKKADEPPKTDDPEGQEQPPKNPEGEGTPVTASDADIAKKLAEQKPPKPTETVVHTEQTKTDVQLEKLANANIEQQGKKTDTESESDPKKPPADDSNTEKGAGEEKKSSEVATDNIESEVHSAFSCENFRPEHSFDSYAKEQYPELNELKSKCVYDTPEMGTPESDIDRTPKGEYTSEERDYLKEIRDKIDAPTSDTVMQKVIGVASGTDIESIKKDLERYLDPKDLDGNICGAHVTGCVAKASDACPFTKTPQECHDNLRLDYPSTDFKNPDIPVYVIRYTNGINYDIPYSKEFGGEKSLVAPMTGNGFLASENGSIPEYTVHIQSKKGAIVTDGEIYRINPDGTEELVAYYDEDERKFKLYERSFE